MYFVQISSSHNYCNTVRLKKYLLGWHSKILWDDGVEWGSNWFIRIWGRRWKYSTINEDEADYMMMIDDDHPGEISIEKKNPRPFLLHDEWLLCCPSDHISFSYSTDNICTLSLLMLMEKKRSADVGLTFEGKYYVYMALSFHILISTAHISDELFSFLHPSLIYGSVPSNHGESTLSLPYYMRHEEAGSLALKISPHAFLHEEDRAGARFSQGRMIALIGTVN